MFISLSFCSGILVWLPVTQSPTQRAWMFSPNSLPMSRTQTLRPMKVSQVDLIFPSFYPDFVLFLVVFCKAALFGFSGMDIKNQKSGLCLSANRSHAALCVG